MAGPVNGAATSTAESGDTSTGAPRKRGGLVEIIRRLVTLGDTLAAMSHRLDMLEDKLDAVLDAVSPGERDHL